MFTKYFNFFSKIHFFLKEIFNFFKFFFERKKSNSKKNTSDIILSKNNSYFSIYTRDFPKKNEGDINPILVLTKEHIKACKILKIKITQNITWRKIKQAYKMLAKKYHPDKSLILKLENHQRFLEINEAYLYLKKCLFQSETILNDPQNFFSDLQKKWDHIILRFEKLNKDINQASAHIQTNLKNDNARLDLLLSKAEKIKKEIKSMRNQDDKPINSIEKENCLSLSNQTFHDKIQFFSKKIEDQDKKINDIYNFFQQISSIKSILTL